MSKELQFLIYSTPKDEVKVNVVVQDETIWLTQKAMADLFDVQTPAINKHLKNIFEEGELDDKVVISKMETTSEHGAIKGKTQTKETNFYNLDAIISVGYRVNSAKATKNLLYPQMNAYKHRFNHLLICENPYLSAENTLESCS